MLWLVEPEAAMVKSKPVPPSGTVLLSVSELLAIMRTPLCWPALAGANSTPAVQLAEAASVDGHVLFTS